MLLSPVLINQPRSTGLRIENYRSWINILTPGLKVEYQSDNHKHTHHPKPISEGTGTEFFHFNPIA